MYHDDGQIFVLLWDPSTSFFYNLKQLNNSLNDIIFCYISFLFHAYTYSFLDFTRYDY